MGAILISGGLDSAILLGETLPQAVRVFPLYIRCGLHYEATELDYLHRYLNALACPALQPLHILDMPVQDLYGEHWSISGRNVPGRDMADEAVFLPGRNVLLLAKAMLWCHLHNVESLALGSLQSNPFPDATPEFFMLIEKLINQSVNGSVRLVLPYVRLSKTEVMTQGAGLPLQHTFSCIAPRAALHCGNCNKCAERQAAFRGAGRADPTTYATCT